MSTVRGDGTDDWIVVRGIRLHIQKWDGTGVPFVLVHGLASNCLTWGDVARNLHAAGHAVVAVDQRGHGRSDKPDAGYGFDEVTADLAGLIETLGLERPIVAGLSWGGNVVVDFAARYPEVPGGVVLVDGGFIDFEAWPEMTWERVAVDLRPPPLAGTPRVEIAARIRASHPEWTDEGIEATLGNFETLPDGTVRPWLTLDRHLAILRAMWEHRPAQLYPRVRVPVLALVAGEEGDWVERKRLVVERAKRSLPRGRVHWIAADHDIHVHRPALLTDLVLSSLAEGFFAAE